MEVVNGDTVIRGWALGQEQIPTNARPLSKVVKNCRHEVFSRENNVVRGRIFRPEQISPRYCSFPQHPGWKINAMGFSAVETKPQVREGDEGRR